MRDVGPVEGSIGRSPNSVATRLRAAGSDVSALDVWAFVLPAMSFIEVRLVGRLIISEMIALALLPWLLRARDRLAVPRWLIALWGAWLASQIISDIVVRSAFNDWARGWAAIVFTMVDLLAVATLAATPRRARIFAVGLAVAGVLGYAVEPFANLAIDIWKWAFAGPTALVIAAGVSGAIWLRRPWVAVLAFAAIGWLNAALLFRSLGGVALLTAVYLAVSAIIFVRHTTRRRPGIARIVGAIAAYGIAGLSVFLVINVASSMDLLGDAARAKFNEQSGVTAAATQPPAAAASAPGTSQVPAASGAPAETNPLLAPGNPLAVLLRGRAELLASPWAILDSPILGHGSWAKDPKYATMQREGLEELGLPGVAQLVDPNLIPTHSYLLGSWVWAGLAGGLFWLGVAALAFWLIANLYTVRSSISPLIVFMSTSLLWNIAFSPYGNSARLFSTYSIALILLGLRIIGDVRASGGAEDARAYDEAQDRTP